MMSMPPKFMPGMTYDEIIPVLEKNFGSVASADMYLAMLPFVAGQRQISERLRRLLIAWMVAKLHAITSKPDYIPQEDAETKP